LIDTHLHLEELGDVTKVVEEAVDAGVTGLIAMGVDLGRSRTAVSFAHQQGEVWAAVGHFPLEPADPDIEALRELAVDDRVVAIGEIGLDFEDAGGGEPARQIERLDKLFGLARELSLPVSIHNRGAGEELVQAITRHPGLRGVMHYFALEWDWAERFLGLGFYLSFAGLITRPSRAALREVVKRCPADRLLLETDSPYGNAHKRMGVPNRPAYLLDTAEVVAELRGLELRELDDLETANAMSLFTRIH
jgi:TatD DNase family protein